jgi:hypothetical protein
MGVFKRIPNEKRGGIEMNLVTKSLILAMGLMLIVVAGTAAGTPQGLVLWNKLGSDDQIQNSEIGPNGMIIGNISYFPAKFGNGFKPQERTGDHNIPDNFIKYENLNLSQKGCIEFWYQPDWNGPSVGHIVNLLNYGLPDGTRGIAIGYNDWQDLLSFDVWNSGSYEWVQKSIIPSQTPGWSTSEPFHIAFTWNGTDPDLFQRAKIFINGKEVPAYEWAKGNPTLDDWGSDFVLHLGGRIVSGDWDRHNWEGSEGVIDNIKIWNYPKIDFSDRFVEEPFPRPIGVDISIKGIPVIGKSTMDILAADYRNFNASDPFNLSIIKIDDGSVVYTKNGSLSGGSKENIPIDWTPMVLGDYFVEAKGSTVIAGRSVVIVDSEVITPIPELSTIVLMSTGFLGLFGLTRLRRS